MNNIIVDSNECTGCKLCLKACAYDAIEIKNKKAVINDCCTSCKICIDACKFSAISSNFSDEATSDDGYSGIWVYVDINFGSISGVVYELLGEASRLAKSLNTKVSAVIINNNLTPELKELALYGADEILFVSCSCNSFHDEIYSYIMTQLIQMRKPEIVLFGATVYGRSLAPRIASHLNTGLTADCTKLEIDRNTKRLLQTRPAFGGNLLATIMTPYHRPQMATVRPNIMEPLKRNISRIGRIFEIKIPIDIIPKIIVKNTIQTNDNSVNLAEADLIVAFGRGIGKPENISIVFELAAKLGGAVGASRAVVDSGLIDYAHQIGQTGKTVAPKVYIALGISGAVQHTAGMSSANTIIAINKDASAPIFGVADYGVVGDVMEIIPELIRTI